MFIFKTVNNITGEFYVGQHNGCSDNYLGSGPSLRKAIKEYGRKNFTREILEVCTPENINVREEYWIRELNAVEFGYNIIKYARGGLSGRPKSEEEKKKAVETRRRNGSYKVSADTKRKMSDSHKGRVASEETRKKMRESWMTRPPISEETNRKNSDSHIGQVAWNKGKKMSNSYRQIHKRAMIKCWDVRKGRV